MVRTQPLLQMKLFIIYVQSTQLSSLCLTLPSNLTTNTQENRSKYDDGAGYLSVVCVLKMLLFE